MLAKGKALKPSEREKCPAQQPGEAPALPSGQRRQMFR